MAYGSVAMMRAASSGTCCAGADAESEFDGFAEHAVRTTPTLINAATARTDVVCGMDAPEDA
ncbi:hypothetical protein N806_18015 [Rhodococcus sp. P27]|nr:hypothetical protein N806_18015 [Rhodococcus sp. P27]